MAERPDSPNAPGNAGKPETPEIEIPEEQLPHHVSTRKKRKKGVGGEDMQLQMTSMIDVVFLLLIYFVITANFTIDEGALLATMPGNSAQDRPEDQLDPPTNIDLTSADDGVTYAILVNGQRIDNATDLASYMRGRVSGGQMAIDDVVQIKPQGVVRWQHVVNVFNACVSAELENVGFAP
ncbi:MAG: biopolymer transporter ExbD [Planctomycetota bacterium]